MQTSKDSDIPAPILNSATTFLSLIDLDHVVLSIGSAAEDIYERFQKRGYKIVGLEADPKLCEDIRKRGFEVVQGSLKNIASLKLPKNIGGVWAGAAFAHTSRVDLEHILEVIHLLLPEKGALFISVPKGQGEVLEGNQVTQYYSEEEFKKLLEEKYFEVKLLEVSTPVLLTAVVTR